MRLFFVFAFAVLSTAYLSAQSKTGSKTPSSSPSLTTAPASGDKLGVQTFGLKIIKSYFDRNCDVLYDGLADQIRSKESGQVFTKDANLKTGLCAESPLRTDIPVSYELYLQNYNPTVYSAAEFSAQFPQLQTAYQLQPGDFFFNGSAPKAAGSTRVFRASDMASFIVRKVNGAWKIIAM